MANGISKRRRLIRGGRVYDHDGDIDQPAIADVLIDGDTIVSIAPQISATEDVEVTNAHGKLLIPGFINAHYHSHDVFAKGMFEEMPFDIWTHHTNPNNYGVRTLEEVRLRTLLGAAEALRNGITTIQDMLILVPREDEYLDTVLAAYEEIGIRVVFSLTVRDRAVLDIAPFLSDTVSDALRRRIVGKSTRPLDEIEFITRQIRRVRPSPGSRQTWALGPSGPQRCSHELLEGIASLQRELDLPVLTHIYETKVQAVGARREYAEQGGSLIEVLDRAGLMNDHLSLIHGVWLTPKEIARVADAGACLVHNPMSNLKLKNGIAPILEYERAGVTIALGCDNCTCGDTQNIFHAMRMLCLLPAVSQPTPGPVTAGYAMRAATLSGAQALGLQGKVGALKPGMLADLVILSLDETSFLPFNSAARQLVFSESGGGVDTVFVSGRPIVQEGKLVSIDEAVLADAVRECSTAFQRDALTLRERNRADNDAILQACKVAWGTSLGFDRYLDSCLRR